MATQTKLEAVLRTKKGTAESRRLRRAGSTPGVVYGHGERSVPIAVATDRLEAVIRDGQRVVDCEMDAKTETAMFREVQWDPFGVEILHFDLLRVDADERVEVEVPIVVRGAAPGVIAGGILDQPVYNLPVECSAVNIPDGIQVRVHTLEIGDAVHVGDLELPEGVTTDMPPDTVVVQVNEVLETEEEEEAEGEPGPAEPELIGEKKEDEEEGGEG